MRYPNRIAILLLAASLLLCACRPVTRPPAAAAPAPLDAATTAKIDAIVQQAMTGSPIPGFQMCVVKDGQVVYSKAFGLADTGEARPMSTQSAMVQGSITKLLTALAVMRLAEQGKIDLDAPVTNYLPYFTMADKRYKDITVRMLLGHRSGLPDSPQYWPEPLDPTLNPLEQAVRDLADMYLLFGPDSGWSYSSYGYSALGSIIAAVTGQQYETYMQKEWLAPLGMTHSSFAPADIAPNLRTTLYASDEQGRAAVAPLPVDERDASAGMLTSSCDDMVKLAQFLLNKGEMNDIRLLQPASIDAMWAPQSYTGWLEGLGARYGALVAQYGLGTFVGDIGGHRVIGHPGAGDGLTTELLLAPDDGLAVVAMDNWFDSESSNGFPAWNAATDAVYTLLGIQPQ